ncbi:MAG: 16S rRNA (adenine(1518)-N(6)/adenine(1519)-N(6))-dimethyltransferase RsmA [Firmicutes bacterium]|nr:16S rRNA (adenine(1518)-N(6)/adenine(1519)-N(6))-dimethyltransferase RsmA [Bacillota bacterium]
MTERIATPHKTKEIIEKYNFCFKKNYGQNFLIDSNIIDNIIKAAEITKDDFVIEIGPGIGSLTQALAESAGKVAAVEIDKNLIPILNDVLCEYDNLKIINNDILKMDICSFINEYAGNLNVKIAANLPYYITSPIIMGILEKNISAKSITVMVQKEVADRMQSPPGTKDYGALSVAVQYYCEAKTAFVVPHSCFMPKPNVESAVISLKPRPSHIETANKEFFFNVVKCAFGQRRKTLINTLFNTGNFGLSKDALLEAIANSGLNGQIRGETLSVEQFAVLSNEIYKKIQSSHKS